MHATMLPYMRLAHVAGAAALCGLAASALAAGTEARLIAVQGEVQADGKAVAAGATVAPGARLVTGANGRLQARTPQGDLFSLPAGSSVELSADAPNTLKLNAGGLRLSTGKADWRVDLGERAIRVAGYLKLQNCVKPCTLPPGLYGRIVQGEAVLEYRGGRSVLRNNNFRWEDAASRPVSLASQPALLDDADTQAPALRARAEIAAQLKTALDAFRDGRDDEATRSLLAVQEAAPGETLVPYYLGLIALRREDNASALKLLQEYARIDPDGAAARDVPKTLTLLSSSQLQQEVATAVARERETVAAPPEPGSIAVQAFVNQGSEAYRAMAKGLAAMVIADLAKVPGLKVLEREKVQLLVNEAKLGDSGLADTASAVRSGRLMRAEKVVVGNFEVQ